MANKIKKGDTVKVIAGKDKEREGKVLSVDAKNHKVTVEGINKVSRHTKPNAQNQQGGIIEKEAPIDASNVMYYDEKSKTASRLGVKVDGDSKVRYMKKGGKEIKEGKKK